MQFTAWVLSSVHRFVTSVAHFTARLSRLGRDSVGIQTLSGLIIGSLYGNIAGALLLRAPAELRQDPAFYVSLLLFPLFGAVDLAVTLVTTGVSDAIGYAVHESGIVGGILGAVLLLLNGVWLVVVIAAIALPLFVSVALLPFGSFRPLTALVMSASVEASPPGHWACLVAPRCSTSPSNRGTARGSCSPRMPAGRSRARRSLRNRPQPWRNRPRRPTRLTPCRSGSGAGCGILCA